MGGKPRVTSSVGDCIEHQTQNARKKKQLALDLIADDCKGRGKDVQTQCVVDFHMESRRRLRMEILRRLQASKVFS
jgi:hypothetical protein